MIRLAVLALVAGSCGTSARPAAVADGAAVDTGTADTSADSTSDTTLDSTSDTSTSDTGTNTDSNTTPDSTTSPDQVPPSDTPVDAADTSAPDPSPCAAGYTSPVAAAKLQTDLLREASGLVASPLDPGVLWLHNDSGDAAKLYAVSTDGKLLATLSLPGVVAVDFEDLAAAACPGAAAACLWVADVGDNFKRRTDLRVHAVPEPSLSGIAAGAAPAALDASTVWTFPVAWPDGPKDCEALAVLPDASALVLFEKVDAADFRAYATTAPLAEGVPNPLALAATLPSPGIPVTFGRMVTGASLHPSATRLALRLYTGTWEYAFDASTGVVPLSLGPATEVAIGPLEEPQGETVAYDAAGSGLWTVSESAQGFQPLHHYDCLDD